MYKINGVRPIFTLLSQKKKPTEEDFKKDIYNLGRVLLQCSHLGRYYSSIEHAITGIRGIYSEAWVVFLMDILLCSDEDRPDALQLQNVSFS